MTDSNALVSFATNLTSSSFTTCLLESIVHHTPLFVRESVYSVLHANKAHTLRRRLDWLSFLTTAQLNWSTYWLSAGAAKVMPGVHSDGKG